MIQHYRFEYQFSMLNVLYSPQYITCKALIRFEGKRVLMCMSIEVNRNRNNVERVVSDNYFMIRNFEETREGL